MRVLIIGSGKMGRGIATRLLAGGNEINERRCGQIRAPIEFHQGTEAWSQIG